MHIGMLYQNFFDSPTSVRELEMFNSSFESGHELIHRAFSLPCLQHNPTFNSYATQNPCLVVNIKVVMHSNNINRRGGTPRTSHSHCEPNRNVEKKQNDGQEDDKRGERSGSLESILNFKWENPSHVRKFKFLEDIS